MEYLELQQLRYIVQESSFHFRSFTAAPEICRKWLLFTVKQWSETFKALSCVHFLVIPLLQHDSGEGPQDTGRWNVTWAAFSVQLQVQFFWNWFIRAVQCQLFQNCSLLLLSWLLLSSSPSGCLVHTRPNRFYPGEYGMISGVEMGLRMNFCGETGGEFPLLSLFFQFTFFF